MAPSFFTMILDGGTIDTGSFPGVGRLGRGPHLVHTLKRVELYLYSLYVLHDKFYSDCTFTRRTGMMSFTSQGNSHQYTLNRRMGSWGQRKISCPLPPPWVLYWLCVRCWILCLGAHIFSTTHKKYLDVGIFTTQQGHAQYLIITEQWKEPLSVLILCHHKDPGIKWPDV